jgi:aminopeptidase N
MFITAEAFQPLFNQVWSKGINHRFAHEIAHQYWGHMIKCPSDEEEWLSEAFAEFSSAFALKQLRGKQAFDRLFDSWLTNSEETGARASIAMANRILLTSDLSYADRTNLLYDKGPLVLFKLREKVGGGLLARFLHGYVKAMAWRFGNTQEMLDLLNSATGKDFSDVFEKYFWGTEMPKVKKAG